MARKGRYWERLYHSAMRMAHTKKYNVMVPQDIAGALMKMEIKRKGQKLDQRDRNAEKV